MQNLYLDFKCYYCGKEIQEGNYRNNLGLIKICYECQEKHKKQYPEKTWNDYKHIETPELKKCFIDELIELYKKYNISIAHEDYHGSFILAPYDDENIEWIMGASLENWEK